MTKSQSAFLLQLLSSAPYTTIYRSNQSWNQWQDNESRQWSLTKAWDLSLGTALRSKSYYWYAQHGILQARWSITVPCKTFVISTYWIPAETKFQCDWWNRTNKNMEVCAISELLKKDHSPHHLKIFHQEWNITPHTRHLVLLKAWTEGDAVLRGQQKNLHR